jgi:AcrR family transcriptional regulator
MPKASKRDQLVEATKELLWEVGYEAMSPRDIQERSAARPGSLYHHFPSKLAIAEAALDEAAAEDIARLEQVFSESAPPLEMVQNYLLLKREAFRGCLIPGFDGAIFSREWKDALWARFSTAAPQRQRQSVERYSIVKRA